MSAAGAIHTKAAEISKLAIQMTTAAGSGHPSSSLSLAHIVTYLMYEKMRYDPQDPWDPGSDRLVLSEGHAVPIVYAAYADLGGVVGRSKSDRRALVPNDVDQLRALDSELDGHPNPAEGMPFFDAATGSLGMGLSVAAGLAAAARLDGIDKKIYCLIGDGESREGQIWEAVDFIADHQLTSVCAIFNANKQGQADDVSPQQSAATLVNKLQAFNWQVVEIDGHNPDEIKSALDQLDTTERPLAIVANTVKGWGADPLLKGNWHGKPLPQDQLDAAYQSLDAKVAELGGAKSALGKPPAPTPAPPKVNRAAPVEAAWPTLDAALEAAGLKKTLDDKGKLAPRRAYGAALKVAGDVHPQVVALDGDVSNSTFANVFKDAHPDRFFECKIAEQNMVSAAVGLAAAGMIPFVNTFAKFIARAYDQIELANIGRANIKLVGSHAGISLAADGPSQMALLDVAFFRALGTVRGDDRESPLCWFFHPADAVAAYDLTRQMARINGMCYMRTHRPDVPLLYKPDQTFTPGGLLVLQEGSDLALLGSGYTVHTAKQAAGLLAKQNTRATVIDLYSYPFDEEKLMEVLRASGQRAVVVEDNYGGGLGAAVAETAAKFGDVRVQTLHVSRIPKSALTPQSIAEYCGVSAQQTADHANALLAR